MDLLREQAGAESVSIPPDEARVRKAEQELMEQAGDDRCQLCGKPLPFLVRLKKGQFCSPHHEREYNAKLAENAVSRLAEFRRRRPVVPIGHDRRIRFRTPTQQPRPQERRLDLELPPLREAQWVEAKSAGILRPRVDRASQEYVGWRPQALRDLTRGVRTDVPHALGEEDWSTGHAPAELVWPAQPAAGALRQLGLEKLSWLETRLPTALLDSDPAQTFDRMPDEWKTHGSAPACPENVTRNERSRLSAAKPQVDEWRSARCMPPQQPEDRTQIWAQSTARETLLPHSPNCVSQGRLPEAQTCIVRWDAEPLLSPPRRHRGAETWSQDNTPVPSPGQAVVPAHTKVSPAMAGVGRAGWTALKIAPQVEIHTAWSAPRWCVSEAAVAMQPHPGNACVPRWSLERRPAVQLPHCEPVPAEEMARRQRLERLRLPSLRLNVPA